MITDEASLKIAGYLFQFQRALYKLFASENANPIIGIETEDDVVEITVNSLGLLNVNFEQDKHSVKENLNPYQDSSKNLWHTLHIWLDAMQEKRSKYDSITYFLATNQKVADNSFASKLSLAKNKEEIEKCIEDIREYASNAKIGIGNGETIKAVAGFSDENLYFLIKNISLKDQQGTATGIDLKSATINLFQIAPELIDKSEEIYTSLFGFLVEICRSYWIKKEPAWIEKSVLTARLLNEITAYRMSRYLERPLLSTAYKQYIEGDNTNHHFLFQLQALKMTDRACDTALNHYWGFYAEKVRLQDEGEILPSQWESRDYELHARWQMLEDNTRLQHSEEKEEVILNKILAATLNPDFKASIGNYPTNQFYFTTGNYHYLANHPKNNLYVCWHPNFKYDNIMDKNNV